jgi:hypothetical protein
VWDASSLPSRLEPINKWAETNSSCEFVASAPAAGNKTDKKIEKKEMNNAKQGLHRQRARSVLMSAQRLQPEP